MRLSRCRTAFRFTALAAMASAVAVSAGCGIRKAPRPPREKFVQRVQIEGIQSGGSFVISLKLTPPNQKSGEKLPARADVYRLTVPSSRKRPVGEDEFAAESSVIASVKLSPADYQRGEYTFEDDIDAKASSSVVYAVRLVTDSGPKLPFSNLLRLEPMLNLPNAPALETATVSEASIALEWSRPTKNIDGSEPANVLGYNVYRSAANKRFRLLNDELVTEERYEDKEFEFGGKYRYEIRAVSVDKSGYRVESKPSRTIEVEPKDTFAPEAPSSLSIGASRRTISIFFAKNPEKDIAGYLVFRSENTDKPLEEWSQITPAPITLTTFEDGAVELGKTYFYYVIAIDKSGNRSGPSEVVTETLPKGEDQ